MDNIKSFRDKFNIPVPDSEIEKLPYVRPPEDSPEIQYLKKQEKHWVDLFQEEEPHQIHSQ